MVAKPLNQPYQPPPICASPPRTFKSTWNCSGPKVCQICWQFLQSKTIKNRDQYEWHDFSVVTMTIANVRYSKPSDDGQIDVYAIAFSMKPLLFMLPFKGMFHLSPATTPWEVVFSQRGHPRWCPTTLALPKMAGIFYDSKMTYKTEELSKSTWMRSLSVSIIADCKVTHTTPSHPPDLPDGFGISDPCRYHVFYKKSFIWFHTALIGCLETNGLKDKAADFVRKHDLISFIVTSAQATIRKNSLTLWLRHWGPTYIHYKIT